MQGNLRSKLSFANVTSALALFVALGGTSYAAITLPRNSVGSKQIRSGAVRSADIHNRSVRLGDISTGARRSLRGQTGAAGPAGPPGPTYRAAVPAGGTLQRGNAVSVGHQGGTNEYRVTFDREVSSCVATATLAAVFAGSGTDQPAPGRVTVAHDQPTSVLVRTFAADGNAAEQPFNLIVAC